MTYTQNKMLVDWKYLIWMTSKKKHNILLESSYLNCIMLLKQELISFECLYFSDKLN